MIVSFAWTTPALLAGAKTMTRRDWSATHAAHFKAGMLVDAWDRSPRTGKAHKVATIRITRTPWVQNTRWVTRNDYRREGFDWLEEHDADCPGSVAMIDAIAADWRAHPREVYVVEFELVEREPEPA